MILTGKLFFAAYRESEGRFIAESVRDTRLEVVAYLSEQYGPEYAAEYHYRPQRVLVIPVDFGQT